LSATTTIEGSTRRAQAMQEARLLVARQPYHRWRIAWEMGAQRYAIARGDVVAFTHGLLGGGATGRAQAMQIRTSFKTSREGIGDVVLVLGSVMVPAWNCLRRA